MRIGEISIQYLKWNLAYETFIISYDDGGCGDGDV